MVYVPLVRPKEVDPEDENEEKKNNDDTKGKKGGKKKLGKAGTLAPPKLTSTLTGGLGEKVTRGLSVDTTSGGLGLPPFVADDSALAEANKRGLNDLETIEEGKHPSVISILPPPHTPLAEIPSREELVAREARKKKAKDPRFDDFSAPFSQNNDSRPELEKMEGEVAMHEEAKLSDDQ